jgi:hypothetical protein
MIDLQNPSVTLSALVMFCKVMDSISIFYQGTRPLSRTFHFLKDYSDTDNICTNIKDKGFNSGRFKSLMLLRKCMSLCDPMIHTEQPQRMGSAPFQFTATPGHRVSMTHSSGGMFCPSHFPRSPKESPTRAVHPPAGSWVMLSRIKSCVRRESREVTQMKGAFESEIGF